jgi:hypothetical protein
MASIIYSSEASAKDRAPPSDGRLASQGFISALLHWQHFAMRKFSSCFQEGGPLMAAFRQHVAFSTALGFGYSAALKGFGWDAGPSLLAGGLCGLAGMLPDLDSDSGKPIKELFGLLATVTSLLVFHRLRSEPDPADRLLIAGLCYLLVRFGVSWLFARMTVHRGMWHSLPAACIAAEVTFLLCDGVMGELGSLVLAGGVLLGFLSHLVLDEIYSVRFNGLLPRLKHSSGTALKLFSDSNLATLGTWLLLAVFSYQSAVRLGYATDCLPNADQVRLAAQAVLAKLRNQ